MKKMKTWFCGPFTWVDYVVAFLIGVVFAFTRITAMTHNQMNH